jgi:hypothetical protein
MNAFIYKKYTHLHTLVHIHLHIHTHFYINAYLSIHRDETWVDLDSGLVLELNPLDVKSLEPPQKVEYSKQLRYQQSLQIKDVEASIRKVLRIWSPTNGLKIPDLTGEELGVKSSESEIEISNNDKVVTQIKKPVTRILDSDSGDDRTLDMILGDPSRELHTLLVEAGYRETKLAIDDNPSGLSEITPLATASLEEGEEIQQPPPQTHKEVEVTKTFTYADYMSKALTTIENCFTEGENSKTGRVLFSDEVPVEQIAPMEGVEDNSVRPVVTEGTTLRGKDLLPSYGLFSILIESDDDSKTVYTNTMALLPPPKAAPMDSSAIPASCVFQIVRKPYPRMNRRTAPRFSILDIEDVSLAKSMDDAMLASEARSVITPGIGKSQKKMSIKPLSAKAQAPAEEATSAPSTRPCTALDPLVFDDSGKSVLLASRWIIQPFSTVQMKIRFRSEKEGKSEAALGFEVVGTGQSVTLLCHGNCEVPHITNDPRNIFMRRLKNAPTGLNAPPPQKRFLMAENIYSFGPLQIFKKPEWRYTN